MRQRCLESFGLGSWNLFVLPFCLWWCCETWTQCLESCWSLQLPMNLSGRDFHTRAKSARLRILLSIHRTCPDGKELLGACHKRGTCFQEWSTSWLPWQLCSWPFHLCPDLARKDGCLDCENESVASPWSRCCWQFRVPTRRHELST